MVSQIDRGGKNCVVNSFGGGVGNKPMRDRLNWAIIEVVANEEKENCVNDNVRM